ncbi:hypothetical protein OIU77_003094 [Salix suchowensis]|uniref:Bifunctional inhibitor/plant lipid transfer protein/seed storage helical domain-containing protein n=1 Tax=Salix suchowensis TaxID=1278906 RepID=A0ABQ9AZQ1_9ROSI|nr:hypothetical protein OIU77_003094 [Salix suchowensis]
MARIVGFLILAISAQAMAKFDVDPDQCQVIFDNFPYCMDFLIGSNDWPSRQCCQRVYDFNALAKHGMGPRAICECIEIITVTIPMKLRVDRISDLPVRCSTHLSFPISEYMDCNRFKWAATATWMILIYKALNVVTFTYTPASVIHSWNYTPACLSPAERCSIYLTYQPTSSVDVYNPFDDHH